MWTNPHGMRVWGKKFFLTSLSFFTIIGAVLINKGEQNPQIEGGARTMSKMTFQPKKSHAKRNLSTKKSGKFAKLYTIY